jgi:hypothetical protein
MENPTYAALDDMLFVTKTLKLGVSGFHAMMLGMQELANRRIPFKNIPRGLRIREALGPELKVLHQEGLDIHTRYADIGGKAAPFSGGRVAREANRVLDLARSWLFDYVQPGMKISFAHDTFNKLLPRYLKKYNPEVTLATARAEIESGKVATDAILRAARDAVKAADGHFSHEHIQRSLLETNKWMVKLYFLPEARKFWQRILLSPTWQREHLLVAKNVAKSFMPDKAIRRLGMEEIGPIKEEYRRYLYTGLAIVGAADAYNLTTTLQMDGKAKHLWQNPKGKGFAVRAPWNNPGYTVIGKDGRERHIQGGPAFIRPLKSLFEVAEFTSDPVKKLGYKLSPIIQALAGVFFPGTFDEKHEGIAGMPAQTRDFILDLTTPISVSQALDAFRGRKTPQAALLPFFGFPVSKVKENAFIDHLLESGDDEAFKQYYRLASKDTKRKMLRKRKEWQDALRRKEAR